MSAIVAAIPSQSTTAFRGHADADVVEPLRRFTTPLKNATMPRWQRKALVDQQENNNNNNATANSLKSVPTPMKSHTDRFIPNRNAMNMEISHFKIAGGEEELRAEAEKMTPSKLSYQQEVRAQLMEGVAESKILTFSKKAPEPKDGYHRPDNLQVLYSQNRQAQSVKSSRHIPQMPERVLDAPELLNDYYLNLLDWSDDNILAVALGSAVFLWNAGTSEISQLTTTAEGDHVTSLSWTKQGGYLAVGTDRAEVQIWDVETMKRLRTMRGHAGRVGVLAWNEHILSSGCRDGVIHQNDVRQAQHLTGTLRGHRQEVCGMKWSPDGSQLASGGNDNLLNIWDARYTENSAPKFSFDHHQSAVKAIAWCPWQSNLLATGGGTADRHIRFWNTAQGTCVNAVDTKSQVCSILWSKEYRELVSSHGFAQNQLTIWKYPTMTKVTELVGHTDRVLHMAMSPDGQMVCSAAADETLRFWKCFETSGSRESGKSVKIACTVNGVKPRNLSRGLSMR